MEKLKQLGEIHVEVNQAVQEIVKLVKGIVPELEQNIDGIATDIIRREEELSGLRTKMMPLQTQISQMNDEIAKLQEAALAVLAPPWAMTPDSTRVAIRSNVRSLYLQQYPVYGQISAILSQYQVKCNCILGDIANRKKFSVRLSNCKNVAQGAGAYERVIDALRPHEREIERLLVMELGDKCVEDVDPKTLKDMRSKVADKYYAEHADYANLVTRRDAVEHMMDAFEVMKVR